MWEKACREPIKASAQTIGVTGCVCGVRPVTAPGDPLGLVGARRFREGVASMKR